MKEITLVLEECLCFKTFKLILKKGTLDSTNKSMYTARTPFTIGGTYALQADFLLDSSQVEGIHARIDDEKGKVWITNMGKKAIMVSGNSVESGAKKILKVNDDIIIGRCKLKVYIIDDVGLLKRLFG